MANSPNPFAGKGAFTTGDPNAVAPDLVGKVDYLVVRVGGTDAATDAQIQQYIRDYIDTGKIQYLIFWEGEPSTVGVNAVKQYGADGYVAQGETSEQMKAAMAIGSQINVPKAVVTDNADSLNYYTKGSGYGFIYEYYKNVDGSKNTTWTPGALNSATNLGAPFVSLALGNWASASAQAGGRNVSYEEYMTDIKKLESMGIKLTGLTAYIYNGMTPEQKKAFQEFINKYAPLLPLAGGGGTGTGTPGQQPNPANPKPKPKPGEPKPGAGGNEPPGQGLAVHLTEAQAPDAPDPYKGGAPVTQTFVYKDKQNGKDGTITVLANGVIIQEVEGGTPFTVWDPSKHGGQPYPEWQKLGLSGPPKPAGGGIGVHLSAADAGGAPPIAGNPSQVNLNDSFHFTDKIGRANTITVMADGTVYQQVEGWAKPQVIYNPANHGGAKWPGLSNPKIYGSGAGAPAALALVSTPPPQSPAPQDPAKPNPNQAKINPIEPPQTKPGDLLNSLQAKQTPGIDAPAFYMGSGQDVVGEKSFHFDTKNAQDQPIGETTTVTKKGAVIQHVLGKTPYRIGWVDPASGYDFSTLKKGDTNPYANKVDKVDKTAYYITGGPDYAPGGSKYVNPHISSPADISLPDTPDNQAAVAAMNQTIDEALKNPDPPLQAFDVGDPGGTKAM